MGLTFQGLGLGFGQHFAGLEGFSDFPACFMSSEQRTASQTIVSKP